MGRGPLETAGLRCFRAGKGALRLRATSVINVAMRSRKGATAMTATRQIRHVVRLQAKPKVIYGALMNSKKHAAFTGAPAKIDPRVGGRFAAWGPHLRGVNVELIAGKRIVQAWRARNWPKGHYSIASFELRPAKGGTVLTFTHVGIPAKNAKSINQGWKTHYWSPLKKAIGAKRGRRR
jgi:activator of HSP90 ATPase